MSDNYDAWGGSWGASWGTSWTPAATVAPPPQQGGGYWDEDTERRFRKRVEHVPNPDRVALRAMLESAFEGKRSEPIAEVVDEYRLPPSAPPQPYGVDWDGLLADVEAQQQVLRAYVARLAQQRHRQKRVAEVAAMQEAIEAKRRNDERRPLRRRLRRIAVRLILSGAH